MNLAEEIEAMRVRMNEEAVEALNRLDVLEKRMISGDSAVMRKIQNIASIQERNAGDIVRELIRIANRIGHGPVPVTEGPAQGPATGQSTQAIGAGPPPVPPAPAALPPGGARH